MADTGKLTSGIFVTKQRIVTPSAHKSVFFVGSEKIYVIVIVVM